MEIETVKQKQEILPDTADERKIIRKGIIKSRKERQIVGQFEKAVTECPECGRHTLVHDDVRAEVVCENCGVVVERDMIDPGPEWRAFDAEQRLKRSRTGPPITPTIHDKGLSTFIDWRNRDLHGRTFSAEAMARFYRLRKWHRRIRIKNARERNLSFSLSEISRMISALGLSNNKSVHELAAVIYRKALEKNLIRGRSIEGMASAALYAACRRLKISRTLEEIGGVSRTSRIEIGRNYRHMSMKLGLKILPASSMEYLPRFCSLLNFETQEVFQKAAEILRKMKENDEDNGKNPQGLAAMAIYKASQELGGQNWRSQRKIANIAGVTEVTIRNNIKIFGGIEVFGERKKNDVKPAPSAFPADLISAFCEELKLGEDVRKMASEIARMAVEEYFCARRPKGIAAAAIYKASQELGGKNWRSQKEIARVANTSGFTIRNILKSWSSWLE